MEKQKQHKIINFFSFYLFRCPTSYERAQNTLLYR